MLYFKSSAGLVHAYETAADYENYAPHGLIKMTDDEVSEHKSQTPEQVQQQVNIEARAYLSATDWYVTRKQETGEPIPDDILQSRAEARRRVVHV